jgi:hypothetical protein
METDAYIVSCLSVFSPSLSLCLLFHTLESNSVFITQGLSILHCNVPLSPSSRDCRPCQKAVLHQVSKDKWWEVLYIVFSFSPLHLLISLSPWPSVDVSLHFLQWSGLRVDWVLLSVATFLWNVEFLSLLLLYFGSAIVGIHIQDCTFWIFHLWLVNVFWHARGMTLRYLGRQTLCLALTHMQFLLLIGCSNPSRCCYENMSTLNARFLCFFPQILIGLLNTWYY